MQITVAPELIEPLKARAVKEGRTRTVIVNRSLARALKVDYSPKIREFPSPVAKIH